MPQQIVPGATASGGAGYKVCLSADEASLSNGHLAAGALRHSLVGMYSQTAFMVCLSATADEALLSNVQLAAAAAGESPAVVEADPQQEQSLEVAGFAGAVAQAYAAYDYV